MGKFTDFYSGKASIHPRGYTIAEVWRWDRDALEAEHDFIQWLFPLSTRSAAVPGSPVIGPEEVQQFRANDGLRRMVRRSLEVMLGFYGLEKTADGRVVRGAGFAHAAPRWLTRCNHNYLRISRILGSLVLLGLGDEARVFHAALLEIYDEYGDAIGATTLGYWNRAIGQG